MTPEEWARTAPPPDAETAHKLAAIFAGARAARLADDREKSTPAKCDEPATGGSNRR